MIEATPEEELVRRYRLAAVRWVVTAVALLGLATGYLVQEGYLRLSREPSRAVVSPPAPPELVLVPGTPAPAEAPAQRLTRLNPSAPFDTWEHPNWFGLGPKEGVWPDARAAEVFTAPGGHLTAVAPFVQWWRGDVRERLLVEVRALPDPRDPVSGVLVATGSTELFGLPQGDYAKISLDRAVDLLPGAPYSVGFSVSSAKAQVGIGFVDRGDPLAAGRFWQYSLPVGGNGEILSHDPSG